ncbi:unnamed protein product [Adineta steineri]|uniref:Uncharacterized protein n=1 Tax=Adineta steineri TaxID=433720 RepID=A0A815SAI1_9BILA|nr:unnamed protein product [Adineta steineri]CAF3867284.1 unnamed protein product [Adineta steineri]
MLTRLILVSFITFAFKPGLSTQNRLLIISLDGFSHDYLKTHTLPTINRFRNEGVQATQGMRPTYVTMTFPNHISIATGSRDEGQWSDPKVEPIWITATKQKKNTAVLFWPASNNDFHGIRPVIYNWMYSDTISFREKIDNAISYFRDLNIQLAMIYHYEPDAHGHWYGTDSKEMHDIGMINIKKVIRPFVDGYLDPSLVEDAVLSGPYFSVTPIPGQVQRVMNDLTRIPNVTIYTRAKLPDRFHYSKPVHRLGDIFVIPNKEGVFFLESKINDTYYQKANHGWDNSLPSMQAIFMARGPSFNQQVQINSLNNVDIYHIACRILNLTPNPYATAGSLDNLTNIFRVKNSSTIYSPSLIHPILFLFLFIFNSGIRSG